MRAPGHRDRAKRAHKREGGGGRGERREATSAHVTEGESAAWRLYISIGADDARPISPSETELFH